MLRITGLDDRLCHIGPTASMRPQRNAADNSAMLGAALLLLEHSLLRVPTWLGFS